MLESHEGHYGTKMGWFLCWAIVIIDIGAGLYYVPGILTGQVGSIAGLYLIVSLVVFLLLALKYVDVINHYPEGGGVVTLASKTFNPWFGALGGFLIIADYFLTISISSISGLKYFNSIIGSSELPTTIAIFPIIVLGILNILGIRKFFKIILVGAVAAIIVDLILTIVVAMQIQSGGWETIFKNLGRVKNIGVVGILSGIGGSFLAFTGIETIAQLAPKINVPRKKLVATAICIIATLSLAIFSVLGLFAINLSNSTTNSEALMSVLSGRYASGVLQISLAITSIIVFILAVNLAIIGATHVFTTLSKQNFMPDFIANRSTKFGTTHWAILLAILPPILIVVMTNGDLPLLAKCFGFGLLGTFVLTSMGVDIVRWKEGSRLSINFLVGLITTVVVFVLWLFNLVNKELATQYGGMVVLIGLIIAYIVYSNKEDLQKSKSDNDSLADSNIENFYDILQSKYHNNRTDSYAKKFLEKASKIIVKKEIFAKGMHSVSNKISKTVNKIQELLIHTLSILIPYKQSLILNFQQGNVTKEIANNTNGEVLIYKELK